MIWFIADTHFSHKNIIKYCSRPYASVEEMNTDLIVGWNQYVGKDELVYHVGDFGFGKASVLVPILEQLNGIKVLIKGNHDKPMFEPAAKELFVAQLDHDLIRVYGQQIFLSHYSLQVWPGSRDGAWHLFGHSHGTVPGVGKSMDVGIDATRVWRPISFDEVAAEMRKRPDNLDYHADVHEGDRP